MYIGLAQGLGILAFKYFNFFIASLNDIFMHLT